MHVDGGKRASLGPVSFKTVRQARKESLERLTRGTDDNSSVPCFRDFATGPWRDSWLHRCKPATIRWLERNLNGRLLPTFGSLRLDRITPAMVHRCCLADCLTTDSSDYLARPGPGFPGLSGHRG